MNPISNVFTPSYSTQPYAVPANLDSAQQSANVATPPPPSLAGGPPPSPEARNLNVVAGAEQQQPAQNQQFGLTTTMDALQVRSLGMPQENPPRSPEMEGSAANRGSPYREDSMDTNQGRGATIGGNPGLSGNASIYVTA